MDESYIISEQALDEEELQVQFEISPRFEALMESYWNYVTKLCQV